MTQIVPDFSEERRPPLRFTMDGDTFFAAPQAPAGALQDLAKIAELNERKAVGEMMDTLERFLSMIILPESREAFGRRLRDPLNPISQKQLGDVIRWLTGEYSGRPTEPASSSQAGQGNTGTSSTDTPSAQQASPSDVWTSVTP